MEEWSYLFIFFPSACFFICLGGFQYAEISIDFHSYVCDFLRKIRDLGSTDFSVSHHQKRHLPGFCVVAQYGNRWDILTLVCDCHILLALTFAMLKVYSDRRFNRASHSLFTALSVSRIVLSSTRDTSDGRATYGITSKARHLILVKVKKATARKFFTVGKGSHETFLLFPYILFLSFCQVCLDSSGGWVYLALLASSRLFEKKTHQRMESNGIRFVPCICLACRLCVMCPRGAIPT